MTLQTKNLGVTDKIKKDLDYFEYFSILFLTLFLPIGPIVSYTLCNEYRCSIFQMRKFDFNSYFDLNVILFYNVFAIFLGLFFYLPIGGEKVQVRPGETIVCNGLFSLFITCSSFCVLEVLNFGVADYITKNLFQFMIASLIFGHLVAIYIHRTFASRTSDLNVKALKKPPVVKYFLGREINPKLFGIDCKFYLFRLSLIWAVLIDLCYFWIYLKNYLVNQDAVFNPSILAICVFHGIYFIDVFLFEKAYLTSYEIRHEGCGYMMFGGYAIYPFLTAPQTRYLVNYDIRLDYAVLVLSSAIFLLGYILFRGANNQKNTFRTNPNHISVVGLKSISTKQGSKLLISGYWGIVRHPNYLGDLLINLAMAPLVYNTPHGLVSCITIPISLFIRLGNDHDKCKQKYGTDWDKYCEKIKYKLIPYVY